MKKQLVIALILSAATWAASSAELDGQDFNIAAKPIETPNRPVNPNRIDLDLCFVKLIDDVDVPASQAGILKTLDVKVGDYVKLNQEFARVDDQVAKQQLADAQARKSIAEKKATDETDIKAAELAYQHAYDEYERERKLVANGAGSKTQLESWKYEAKKALMMIQRAKNEKQLAELDKVREEVLVKTAKDAIERHMIRTPIEGNVFEVYQPAGSWVNAGDKVVRVIRMNKLKVQGFVNAGQYDRHQVAGQKVTVTATLAGGRTVNFQGTISYVGLDELAGNRFMVWAEVENKSENGQWQLVPNDEVQMQIHLNGNPVASKASDSESQFRSIQFKSTPDQKQK